MKIVRAKFAENGFSLIELMIVVAIVAILAAVAVPSYQRYILKTNRSDAMAVLQGFAQAMERHYAQNNSYLGAASGGDDDGIPAIYSAQAPIDGAVKYNLTIEPGTTATQYTLRATPTGAQAADGYLEITNTGLRRWDKDNSDSIEASENTWAQ